LRIFNLRFPAVVLILIVFLLATGCAERTGDTKAGISDCAVSLGTTVDGKPVNPTVVAPDTKTIYCSAKLSNLPDDTEIVSIWIYIVGEVAILTNYEIGRYSVFTHGTDYMSFLLTRPDKGFPRRNYKVVLSINGKNSATVPFTVE